MNIYWYTDLDAEQAQKAYPTAHVETYLERTLVTLDVQPADSSYRYRALMETPKLILKFSLPVYVDLPVGLWCEYMAQRFYLGTPANFKKHGVRNFEYTLEMGTLQDGMSDYKLRNMVDGRLKFSLCAKPQAFLQLIVDNLNERDGNVWSVGDYIDSSEKTIEFNHSNIDAALQSIADEFNTEWEIVQNGASLFEISLGKVEYNKINPVRLSYGRGKGFVPGVGRTSKSDEKPIKRLYTEGTDRNIDRSKYGSSQLHLPTNVSISYDGTNFDDECESLNPDTSRTYITDSSGAYIERTGIISQAVKEDSIDCSEIYPSRIGEVTDFVLVDDDKNFYDLIDDSIPDNLDYSQCIIAGEDMTIVFQSGMLAGKEFKVKYFHEGNDEKRGHRFEIVPQEYDGVIMPNETFKAVGGNKYAVFGIQLPDSYICDNVAKKGAEWDMLREAVKYLYEHEDQKFTFTGELQGLWAKQNWASVGGRIVIGGYVMFRDDQFAKDGVLIRITGIKDYVNSPYSPIIEISNSVGASSSVSKQLNEIESAEVKITDAKKSSIEYTKRRFRDAIETISMLQSALNSLSNEYSESINPITVKTMQVLIGDEGLQFQFVRSLDDMTRVNDTFRYDQDTKTLGTEGISYIQHLTLGTDKDISSKHNRRVWQLADYASPPIVETEKSYYVYAVCRREENEQDGYFTMSDVALDLEGTDMFGNPCYNLLCGVLNSEYDGERSFITLYGFTEILPGRITTDRVVSGDGRSYFDMVNNAFALGDNLQYNVDGSHEFRLKGTIVQSPSGDEFYVPCYRGAYSSTTEYFPGDTVTYTNNGGTSSYICIARTIGNPPTLRRYWNLYSSQGSNGITPNTAFKSYVFKRSNEQLPPPSGGDYLHPAPDGWSDGVPDGDEPIWCSTRIFSSDGLSPQQAQWTEPTRMSDTSDFDVEFSSVAHPDEPLGHPNTNPQWSNEADDNTIWMATSRMRNGQWSDWEIAKIKGERGPQGIPGPPGISPNTAFKSYVFRRSNDGVLRPTGGSYVHPLPDDDNWSDGVPDGDAILWCSTRMFSSDGEYPQDSEWSIPRQMTDTSDFDVEFSSLEAPQPPSGHPNTNHEWSNVSDDSTIWMATSTKSNGEWSNWQVARIKGEKGNDGTSIKIKGSLGSVDQLPDPDDESDCYIIGQNLWVWDGDSWVNAGQFKGDPGDPGKSAYVHIKYANSETYNDWTDNDGETPGAYIGIYADHNPIDQLDWSLYRWMRWQGEDGFGYEYIFKRTNEYEAPDTPDDYSEHGDYQSNDYVPAGWTDDPQDVTVLHPYCWVCYRTKANGHWGRFVGSADDRSKAALWAKYGSDGISITGTTQTWILTATYNKPTADDNGWSETMPKPTDARPYLWCKTTYHYSDGDSEDVISLSCVKGKDGAKGDLGPSPGMVYRGDYDPNAVYYGYSKRLDCVKYNGRYYIAVLNERIGANGFSGHSPEETGYWANFGASFESVATNLLLAEMANIGGWIMKDNRLISQVGTVNGNYSEDYANDDFVPAIILDAVNGRIWQGDNLLIDSDGLTMFDDYGNIAAKFVNRSIGSEADLSEPTATESYSRTFDTQLYNPAKAQFTMPIDDVIDLGYFARGSTITISNASMAMTVIPPDGGGGAMGFYPSCSCCIELLRGWTVVKTINMSTVTRGIVASNGVHIQGTMSGSDLTTIDGLEFLGGQYRIRIRCMVTFGNGVSKGTFDFEDVTTSCDYSFGKSGMQKTLIGSDGMYSCWGNNRYFFASDNGITLRFDDNMLRIDSDGIKKTSDGVNFEFI